MCSLVAACHEPSNKKEWAQTDKNWLFYGILNTAICTNRANSLKTPLESVFISTLQPCTHTNVILKFPKNTWCKHIMSWFLSTTDLKHFEFWQTPLAIWYGGLEEGAHFGLFVYPLGITEMRRQESWRPFGASQYCMAPVRSNESLEEISRSCPWPGLAPSQRQAQFLRRNSIFRPF